LIHPRDIVNQILIRGSQFPLNQEKLPGMTGVFQTRWATIIILGEGKVRVNSDGILDCGEWSNNDLEKAIDALKSQGWALVGSVDRRLKGCNPREATDLFFRMSKEGEEKGVMAP
jgi:hypothetical protein